MISNPTADEVSAAESQEQRELEQAQQAHLKNRVVLLRMQVNRLEAELADMRGRLEILESPEVMESNESVE